MWRFTHDPKYRQWGWEAAQVNNVYKRLHCAPCSFWFEWLEQFVRTSAFLCILWTTREDVIRHLLDLLCSTEQVQYESLFSQTKRSSNSHCICLHGQNISFSAVYSEKNSIPTQQLKLNQRNQYSTKASVNIQPCTLRLTCINMLSIRWEYNWNGWSHQFNFFDCVNALVSSFLKVSTANLGDIKSFIIYEAMRVPPSHQKSGLFFGAYISTPALQTVG